MNLARMILAVLLTVLISSTAAAQGKDEAANPQPSRGMTVPANSPVHGIIRLLEFSQSEEVEGAASQYFDELQEARHPGCATPATFDVGDRNGIALGGLNVIDFPAGAARPNHAQWSRSYEATLCGATSRESVLFEVKNGGPVFAQAVPTTAAQSRSGSSYAFSFGSGRQRRSPPSSTTEYTYPGDDDDHD